jgi:hypothetical protein
MTRAALSLPMDDDSVRLTEQEMLSEINRKYHELWASFPWWYRACSRIVWWFRKRRKFYPPL